MGVGYNCGLIDASAGSIRQYPCPGHLGHHHHNQPRHRQDPQTDPPPKSAAYFPMAFSIAATKEAIF